MQTSNVLAAAGLTTAAAGGLVSVRAEGDREAALATGAIASGGAMTVAGSAAIAKRGWTRAFDAKIGARALTPHEIRRADVGAFLAQSAVQDVVFHAGPPSTITRMSQHGAGDLARRGSPGLLGAGLYTTQRRPSRIYGPETAAVAIDARRPLVVWSFEAFDQRFKPLGHRPMSEVREAVLASGYDSIVLNRRFNSDWVVAVESPSQARVVVADVASDRLADAVGSVRRGIARVLGKALVLA